MRFPVAALIAVASCTGRIGDGPTGDAGPIDASVVADAPASASDASGDATSSPADAPVAASPDASVHVCPPSGPLDCSPGTGTGEGDQCADAPSCFLATVKNAVTGTVNDHPEWFGAGPSCPLVLDVDAYMNEVVARVVAAGLCAIRDPNDPGHEITVKHDNAFSENHRILAASTGCARWGDAIYTGYCAPAWW